MLFLTKTASASFNKNKTILRETHISFVFPLVVTCKWCMLVQESRRHFPCRSDILCQHDLHASFHLSIVVPSISMHKVKQIAFVRALSPNRPTNQPTNQIAEKTTKFVYNTVSVPVYAAGTNHICRYGEWSFRYCITRLGPPLTTSGGSADRGQFSMLMMAKFWHSANSYGSFTSEALSLM